MWNVIKDLVWRFAENFFNSRSLSSSINEILIVLILKISAPEFLSHYKPISLCIVMYKLLAKSIVSRLKLTMPKVIALNQCSFVPDR